MNWFSITRLTWALRQPRPDKKVEFQCTDFYHRPSMPPKPEHELTVIEIQVLNAASRFLAAAAKFLVTPPRPEEEEYISGKVAEELVRLFAYPSKETCQRRRCANNI